jgi:hypothetical protein
VLNRGGFAFEAATLLGKMLKSGDFAGVGSQR